MKRLILPAALAFALSGALAVAQQPQQAAAPPPDAQQPAGPGHFRHHPPSPEREVAHLTKQLNLTPDQASKLEPILADRDQKVAALMSNSQLAPDDLHKQRHEIEKSTQEQLATVLTPDQLQQMKADRHHGRHGHPGGPEGPGGPDQAPPPLPPPGSAS
jgi:protein CpxP